MRMLKLEGYKEGEQGDSVNAYVLLYLAVFKSEDTLGPDPSIPALVAALMDQLDAAGERIDNGAIRLKPEGATMVFEEAEFVHLQKMWASFRSNLKASSAREVMVVEQLLQGAEKVKPEALAAK